MGFKHYLETQPSQSLDHQSVSVPVSLGGSLSPAPCLSTTLNPIYQLLAPSSIPFILGKELVVWLGPDHWVWNRDKDRFGLAQSVGEVKYFFEE